MVNALNVTLYYGQTQPHCSGSRQRAIRRANADDVYHRRSGRTIFGSECLLRHLADHHDRAGVNAECVPFVDVDATLQPPGWVLDRGGGRNARRFDQRLCFVRWVVCNISNRQLFQRHLYVCTGVLPLCSNRWHNARISSKGYFLCDVRRPRGRRSGHRIG